jgi:hypothetical protein
LPNLRTGDRVEALLAFRATAPGSFTLELTARAQRRVASTTISTGDSTTVALSVTPAPAPVIAKREVADLAVSLATTGAKPAVGAVFRVVATISNRGTAAAAGVVRFRRPAAFQLLAVTSTGARCTKAPLRCAVPSLHGSRSIRVVLSLRAVRRGAAAITAGVHATGAGDGNDANDAARLSVRPAVAGH